MHLNPIWKRALQCSFLAYLGLRLWSSLVLLLGIIMPPRMQPADPAVFETLSTMESSGLLSRLLLAPWYRWDSVYYLEIAKQGYTRSFTTVWPPLYPWLVRLVSGWISPPLLAAILVSNVALIVALTLLYRLVAEQDEPLARKVIILLVLFPTSFFLIAGYSESLFLAFAIGCLALARQRQWGWAGLAGAAAALIRLPGIALVLPILVEGLSWLSWHSSDRWMRLLKLAAALALVPLAVAIFSAYIHWGLGFPWPWETLNINWAQHMGWPWEGIAGNITSLVGIRTLNTPISAVARTYDLLLVALFSAWMCMARRRTDVLPVSFQVYAWAGLLMLLIKVDNQSLMVSASRYLIGLFPMFIAQALTFKRSISHLAWFAFGLASQAVLLMTYYWWVWVA